MTQTEALAYNHADPENLAALTLKADTWIDRPRAELALARRAGFNVEHDTAQAQVVTSWVDRLVALGVMLLKDGQVLLPNEAARQGIKDARATVPAHRDRTVRTQITDEWGVVKWVPRDKLPAPVAPQLPDTFPDCGHPYKPNAYVSPFGDRRCRTCRRAAAALAE